MSQDRQQQQRDNVGDLDHRVDRGPGGILIRIADRVPGYGGFVRLRSLAAVVSLLDLLFGVVPSPTAVI